MTNPVIRPITELLSLAEINELSLLSNFRYGRAIYTRGAVEYITQGELNVEAWVGGLDGTMTEGGGSRRRVQLSSTKDGLKWHCTGNPKNHQIFCKHCVALALDIMHRNSV